MGIILKKLKPYRLNISITVVFLFVSVICDLLLPTVMGSIVDSGINKGDVGAIIRYGAMMLGISLVAVGASIAANYISAHTSMGFGRDLRSSTFRKITDFSLHEVDKFGTSTLITRNTNDIVQIQMIIMMGLRMMVDVPLHLVGGTVLAIGKGPKLIFILGILIPLLALVIFTNIKLTTPLFKVMQTKLDHLNRVLREKLIGVRVIRAFNNDKQEAKRFNDTNLDLTQTSLKASRRMAMMMPATMIIMNGASLAALWFGSRFVADAVMPTGDLMAFTQYMMQIMMSIMMASMMVFMLPRGMVSMRRIADILNVENEITDPDKPEIVSDAVRGKVSFDKVTFRYPGAESPVLHNISFEVSAGQTLAIIGSTGSGKSTLINLIPRYYDIESGTIKLDGVDIRKMKQEDLRQRLGYVPQKALLFSGTVSDNIAYGNPDASAEEIRGAADIAQATEFIDSMEEGFDSWLSQDATNVSGGQKQRISIARAVCRRPEVYIFDDSFSALDFKTDALLREALRPITRDAAVIIVAQRVSTVMNADTILVLDEGEMVGMGGHRELLTTCPVYREIVASQLSEEEIA